MNRRRYTNGMDDDRITDRRAGACNTWMDDVTGDTASGLKPLAYTRLYTTKLYCHQYVGAWRRGPGASRSVPFIT